MFRMTLRDLFWLTLVAAVLVVWWLDDRNDALVHERDAKLIDYWKKHGGQRVVVRLLPGPPAKPTGLRPVPGEWDYQFPPDLPLQSR